MNPHLIPLFFAVVSNEDAEPPAVSLPDPQDTFANVQSDPPCIDSAPTEHSEPQAEQAHGRQRAMAQVRPINIADAVGGIAGSNFVGAVRKANITSQAAPWKIHQRLWPQE